MLKKKFRLKTYSAFIATYKLNNLLCDKNICIYVGKEKTDYSQPTKFAFVVAKKVHKRAVKRNRIKRLMRESVRQIIFTNDFNFIHNYISVIFVARKNSLNASFSDISCSVQNLLKEKCCN